MYDFSACKISSLTLIAFYIVLSAIFRAADLQIHNNHDKNMEFITLLECVVCYNIGHFREMRES